MEVMKDGAIVCNTGHFNVEIDIPALEKMAASRTARCALSWRNTPCRTAACIYLLAEGRLVNLSAAEGHPAQVMDMSFANQALAAEFIVKNHTDASRTRSTSCRSISTSISPRSSSRPWAFEIDTLTPEQEKYLASWNEGT